MARTFFILFLFIFILLGKDPRFTLNLGDFGVLTAKPERDCGGICHTKHEGTLRA